MAEHADCPLARRAPRKRRGLCLVLASVVATATGAFVVLPRVQQWRTHERAREASAAAIACLFDELTPTDRDWRGRQLRAALHEHQSEGWPACCRQELGRARTALWLAARAAARCDKSCCLGDRVCAAHTQLLASLRLRGQRDAAIRARWGRGAASADLREQRPRSHAPSRTAHHRELHRALSPVTALR
jgi:hypothetical protein